MLEIMLVLLALLMPQTEPTRTQVGKATTFYPIEKGLNNGILGCTGEKWVDADLPYCASRKKSLCGQWVLVENARTKDVAWCKVMDRGPYGKRDANDVWFNSATDRKEAEKEGREPRKGTYLSILDMGHTVADKLKSKGRLKVRVHWWKNNPLATHLDAQLLK